MEIKIEARSVYGTTSFYPANDAAQAIAEIAGTKTLTLHALKAASKLPGATISLTNSASQIASMLINVGIKVQA